jgi:signal transduction histidine kinase
MVALDGATVAALSAGLLVLLLLAFGRYGARTALPLALGSVPLALAASLLALRGGVWCSPAPYALAAVLAYPLWSWRRLERAMSGIDEEIARIAAEPLVAGAEASPPADAAGDAIETRLQTLQRASNVVRQAGRFLADALAALPTAMLVADEQARVVLANPKAAAMFEVELADDLLGLDLVRLLAEFALPEPFDWAGAIAALGPAGAGIALEGRLGGAAGGRDFVVHLAAVDLHGQRRLIVTIADVEPVKQAQRARDEVLAFVSHDLRSPATSIMLLADLNLHGAVQTPPDELLREVRRLAARTLAMSEDFVRAAQVQTRPLARAPVAVAALLDEALADLRPQALAAGVVLQPDVAGAGPEVAVDRALVVRAVANLVSNAIKHSPPGTAVEVQAEADDQWLRVRVRDRGPGLKPDQIVRLALGDRGLAVRDARGVGLGLLFVQRVARRHGGSLRALAPARGGGALFELELPLQPR